MADTDPTTTTTLEAIAAGPDLSGAIDTLWVSIATYLVFFMQAGFALLELGTVRAKNAQNILLKNILDVTIATVVYWLVGYGVAYGKDQGDFLGGNYYGAKGFHGTSGNYMNWMFQWAFAGTAATIVSGALAERTQLRAYAIFSAIMSLFIYPVVTHWVWGGGWLSKKGFHDFAGSGVVHLTGGAAALVGALAVGPRIGRFDIDNDPTAQKYIKNGKAKYFNFNPHSVPFVVLGTLILWFGWYGFNCGSTLGITGENQETVSRVGMTTTIAAAAGGISSLLMDIAYQERRKGRVHVVVSIAPGLTNGILGGLVSITASCDVTEPYAAFIIGLIGGMVCWSAAEGFRRAGLDDPLDASSVHGACGAWGCIAVGFFDHKKGVFYGGSGKYFGYQIAGVCAIFAWTATIATIFFLLFKMMKWLRVSEEVEMEGLDKKEHGGSAYNLDNDAEYMTTPRDPPAHRQTDFAMPGDDDDQVPLKDDTRKPGNIQITAVKDE